MVATLRFYARSRLCRFYARPHWSRRSAGPHRRLVRCARMTRLSCCRLSLELFPDMRVNCGNAPRNVVQNLGFMLGTEMCA